MIEPTPSKSTFELIRKAVASVHSTEHFSAQEVLARYPELRDNHSALVDLAYEEYCQARDRGDTIDQKRFAAQFPEVEKSLLELLEVHSFVVGNSLLSMKEPEVRWPVAGETFLGFELQEEIGQGAFARVFLARETGVGNREVVVKISQRGSDEASLLGLLDHPNIVPIYSVASDEVAMLSALCMPSLGRTTASQWIETRFKARGRHFVNSPRHLSSVIEIGKGVCQGLQYAHEKKVLHCDVKPSNILITHDGEPLLLDFNLSTDQSSEKHLVGGTLMFMAPEQLERASGNTEAEITPATDVFCLAATLYQMASGQPAFPLDPNENAHLKEVIKKSLKLRKEFAEQNHPVPEPLLSVLKDALAFDAKDRIATAAAFFERLSGCEKALAPKKRAWQRAVGVLLMIAAAFAIKAWVFDTPPGTDPGISDSRGPGDDDPPEPPKPSAPLTLKDCLELAQDAESREEFQEAVENYQRALEGDPNEKPLPPEEKAEIRHSLAFCMLMNHQASAAHRILEELIQAAPDDETIKVNRTASLLLTMNTVVSESGDMYKRIEDLYSLLRPEFFRKTDATKRPVAEYHYLHGITAAMLINSPRSNENSQVVMMGRSVFDSLELGLSKHKAVGFAKTFPSLLKWKTRLSLTADDLQLEPDCQVDVPVQSPTTNKFYRVTVPLSDLLPRPRD